MPEPELAALGLSADPSPHSSSSNTTPVTDNLGDLIVEDRDLPESAKQPILDTVDSRQASKMNNGNDPTQTDESPRSINKKQSVGVSPQNMPPARSRPPQHRRNHSEELPTQHGAPEMQQQYYGGYQMPYGSYQMPPPASNMPPPQMLPSPRPPQGAPRPRRTPPTGPRRPSHNRSRSWNPQPNMMAMQGLSAAGNPLIPFLQDPGSAGEPFVYAAASPAQGRRKRSYPDSGRPRAFSASLPTNFSGNPGDLPPPPPSSIAGPQQQPWSPRVEILSLTKGFNTRRSPPASPKTGNNYRSSPKMSPGNSSLRGGYGSRSDNFHVQFSAGTAMDHPFSASTSVRGVQPWQQAFDNMPAMESDALMGNGGGEAVSDSPHRSKRSNRKMHMRQNSAQIFMEDVKGFRQAPVCRNVLFVMLFLLHMVGMAFLGATYGQGAYRLDSHHQHDQAVTLSYRNVIYVASLCGAFAVVISTCALVIMMSITKKIVQLALILTISLSFAWGTIGIGLSPKNFVPITGIIALALSVGYAFVVWDRIPFAAANLHSGLSAVRANMGTVLVAFVFQGVALAWTIYYTFVVIGVYDALKVGDLVLSDNMHIFVYTMLGISYYWTFHVLTNIVQVTVTGAIGSWWFKSDATDPPFWNQSTSNALFSAVFYSIGSICFGSLLVGPVRLIRQLSAFFRPAQEDSILMCLHECVNIVQQCMANCVDNLSDHFNPYALTYVGLYGYGLLDAGHNATELFEKRGWTTIVSDDLVANVLLMFSIVVGGVTGCFGMLLQRVDGLEFSSFHEPTLTAFLIGFGVGWVLTSVLFAIISSSVNAVIVCFAGSPLEFEQNHPQLSVEMRSAWREVWPGCMNAVDMTVGLMTGGPQAIL